MADAPKLQDKTMKRLLALIGSVVLVGAIVAGASFMPMG